jgi:nicotinic acid mononucleotide adenylyltransferase
MKKNIIKNRLKKRVNGSKFINLNPSMNESKSGTAVITFGRFSPPTIGHEKLVAKVVSEAKSKNGTPIIYVSHSFDKKKNPLSYDFKIKYLKKAFGNIVQNSRARTIIEIAKELQQKFDNLVMIVGSDRVGEFQKLLNAYNGKEYNFKNIEVVSAGERDPDAEGVSGMSASKLRALAAEGNFNEFKKGIPRKLASSADEIFKELRSNMGIEEEALNEDEINEREALTVQQRRQRGRTMRRYKSKLATARKRARRRKASPEKMKERARRRAREIMRQRFLQGRSYGELSPSEKVQVDKRLLRVPASVISRIATRQIPKVRQAEMERLSSLSSGAKKESIDNEFESFLSERRECPPKRPHMAMTKEGKVKFDKRFKFFRKNIDENFIQDAHDLMESVENLIFNESNLDKSSDDPCWDGYVKLGTKKKGGKEVPNCVPKESANPADREQGTDSLVRIYKKDTPGEKTESYFNTDQGASFGAFRNGSKVSFLSHSMDMADGDAQKEGTVVGSNVQHLRVRGDNGLLYKVRHADAKLVEATVSGGFEGEKIKIKDKPLRMVDGSIKKMAPGKSASSKHGD